MCKNKHLSLDDRLIIERELGLGKSFKYIGNLPPFLNPFKANNNKNTIII